MMTTASTVRFLSSTLPSPLSGTGEPSAALEDLRRTVCPSEIIQNPVHNAAAGLAVAVRIDFQQFDKAITPLDYAFAIDSEDLMTIELRGITLLHLDRIEEALRLLQPYYKANMAADNRLAELYARALIGIKRFDAAAKVLTERAMCRIDDFTPIEILLKLRRPEAHELLSLFYNYCVDHRHANDWISRIEEFYEEGDF